MNHLQNYLLLPNSVLSTCTIQEPCVIQEPSTELYWHHSTISQVTTTALEASCPFDSRHRCPSPTLSNALLVFWIPLVILEHPGLPGLKFSSNTEVKQGGSQKAAWPSYKYLYTPILHQPSDLSFQNGFPPPQQLTGTVLAGSPLSVCSSQLTDSPGLVPAQPSS